MRRMNLMTTRQDTRIIAPPQVYMSHKIEIDMKYNLYPTLTHLETWNVGIESCLFDDNFRCRQWLKFLQKDISI